MFHHFFLEFDKQKQEANTPFANETPNSVPLRESNIDFPECPMRA
jgi:hypothetical protein